MNGLLLGTESHFLYGEFTLSGTQRDGYSWYYLFNIFCSKKVSVFLHLPHSTEQIHCNCYVWYT